MTFIGNLLWFVFGGGIVAWFLWVVFGTLCAITIIGLPFAKAAFQIAGFAAFPFGRELVDSELVGGARVPGTGFGNFVWVVLAGLWLAIAHTLTGVAYCLTLIGIPFGLAHFKLAVVCFAPLGKTTVSNAVATEAIGRGASAQLDRRLGPKEAPPSGTSAWFEEGESLRNQHRYEEAIDCFDKALEIDQRHGRVWNCKGHALSSLHRYEEAIDCFDKALEIDSRRPSAWSNKGASLAGLGRYEAAILCFNKALEIDPSEAVVWSLKGQSLGILCRDEEAIQCYDKAVELDPHGANPWYHKALLEDKLGRSTRAAYSYQQFLAFAPAEAITQIEQARKRWHELLERLGVVTASAPAADVPQVTPQSTAHAMPDDELPYLIDGGGRLSEWEMTDVRVRECVLQTRPNRAIEIYSKIHKVSLESAREAVSEIQARFRSRAILRGIIDVIAGLVMLGGILAMQPMPVILGGMTELAMVIWALGTSMSPENHTGRK
jgi:uncharacterized membrane protein YccF (DUF307 family)/Tfp pilus assembly protein PilF